MLLVQGLIRRMVEGGSMQFYISPARESTTSMKQVGMCADTSIYKYT